MTKQEQQEWNQKAIRMAEVFFREFYEKRALPKDVMPRLSERGASWIGASPGEFYPSAEEAIQDFSIQRDREDVPLIIVGEGRYIAQPIAEDVILVLCEVPLRTDPSSGLVLMERQRASFLFHIERGELRLCHVHASNPWVLMKKESRFAMTSGRANYEYLQQLLAEEKLAGHASLSGKQKLVLNLLSQGRTYDDISEIMNISSRTVRYHVTELCRKFGVSSRAQLLALISTPPR